MGDQSEPGKFFAQTTPTLANTPTFPIHKLHVHFMLTTAVLPIVLKTANWYFILYHKKIWGGSWSVWGGSFPPPIDETLLAGCCMMRNGKWGMGNEEMEKWRNGEMGKWQNSRIYHSWHQFSGVLMLEPSLWWIFDHWPHQRPHQILALHSHFGWCIRWVN